MKTRKQQKSRLSVAEELLSRLTPEQQAARYEAALRTRQWLRNEAARGAAPAALKAEPHDRDEWEKARRAHFAAAMAQAAFGRFYWKAPRQPSARRKGNGSVPSKVKPL